MDPKDLVFTSLGFRMGTQTTYFPSCGCTWAGEEKYCPVHGPTEIDKNNLTFIVTDVDYENRTITLNDEMKR